MSELELEQEQDLEQRISSLSPQRRRLLELMRGREPAPEASQEPARTAPFSLLSEADRRRLPEGLEDAYPLTQVQLGMLYHMAQTTDASTPTYHNVNSLHVRMPFDPEIFQETVDQLVAEREVFRVSFDLTSYSEPLQLVHRTARLEVQVVDLRHLPEEEQQREIDAFIREENRRLVDLSRPPLIRYHVHRRAGDRFQFTLTEPHAISDGWSTNSSLVDLVSRYWALLRGETPPPAPRLAVTYRDFVALEREALRSEEVRGFWLRKLSDYTLVPLPRWPAHLRPSAPSADRKPTVEIPSSVLQGLLRLMRTAEVPFKNVTLAAHLKVMCLLSGGDEVVTGLTTNGRPEDVDGDQVRGLFLNTLPLRFRVPPGTWIDLARAALAAELELMPYRRYPLAALQRLRGGQPLFESGFSSLHFHNFERADLVGSIQVLSHGGSDLSVTHFPLGVTFQRMPPTGLVLTLELNDPALTEEQGRLFHGYYRRVLESMADDPHARHDDRTFLSERELHQVLVKWNPPERDFRTGECLHEIFARQARRTPNAVAVSSPGREPLTYGDLDRLSDRLAHRLRACGVGPESLVGVCLERSPALLVALLGVLKAGGAYVPLDPAYPQARLDYLLQDSGARLVISEEWLLDVLSGEDADGEIDLPSGVLPESPAYVIYTSGSTGHPKGVVVTHDNVTRLFSATREWFELGEFDVWTLFHSFAFDFSVWEMWGALLHGGRLVVVPYLVSRSPAELYRLLVEEGVTVLNQTPSAFRQLLQVEPEAASLRELALRLVIFGGEALDPLALKPWLDRHGDERPRLINMYGITETTVHVTYRPVRSADVALGMGSWIGGPIPDLRLYCLDAHLFPVPAGVPGEIHVGGAGLARGYLGRPALTAERFIPDPFGGPGARLYKSGDLARFLPDGELEYLGRADHQVKIRGFRIELGEIGSALREHPGLREAEVLARQDDGAEARLVAYVVPKPGAEPPSVSDLRAFLAARLPEHAVPSAFVLLDELPLTVNGKLDRRALPAPDSARPDLAVDFVAPRDAREQALAEVWAEVLGVERVGVHDNFFSLGGDSIRSIQVIARAGERGLALTIQQLFQHPTVAGLAAILGEAGETGKEAVQVRTAPFELVATEDLERLPAGLEDAYPLTRLQTGMLFHMDLNSEAPLYHNVETYHLEAPFALEPLREALRRIIVRHPVLRTSFDLSSWSEPLQLVHAQAELPLEVEDLRGLDEARQEEIIAERFDQENRVPFDLARAPQWRVVVHRRTESTFQFTFVENHAIFDGWSLYSTLAELFRHYSALLKGAPLPEEPPPPIPFREFVAQEREVLRSGEAKAFWSRLLSGATFLQVPLWRPVPPPEPGSPNMIIAYPPVPPEVAAGLQRLAAAAGLPLKNVLLAAHMKVLARLSGQEDVVTGLVMNGRAEAMGGEETRGLFLNTVPFRLHLPGGTWADLTRTSLAAEQRMLPFRRYPVSELQNQMGGRPLFQTIFNYTHFHVIQGVVESGEVFVRGYRKSTETNFTLAAGVSLDSATQQIVLEVAGAAGLMPPEELEAIASWYGRALAEMAADPQARHDESSLLSRAEIHQILAEWNDTAGAAGPETLHELFERSAERDPEAVAVVADGERITYGELERRANRLAHQLRSLGVRPGVLVGIYLDRSAAMVPALLGVLKAGGAYVPIANGWPLSRTEWILGAHGVRHLITQSDRLDIVRELQRALPGLTQVACVDDPELARLPARRPRPLSDAGDLAYIIFTSGSTGRPKGVMVRHQPVVSLIGWLHETFGIGPADRVLFITSLSFDLSVYDVFGLLAAGGSIQVASSADLEEPERLVRLLRDEPVTFWDSAPAALQQLVPLFSRVPDLSRSRLRLVFLSGDWIPLPLPDLVRESFPGAQVVSLGGATEATIWSNWHPVRQIDPRWNSIPYGRPIRNARYHVLDGGLVPCPVGAPGDLYIGGGCLSSGYAGEPALTAERYLPDPFGSDPGGRIYRTGDRARHWPDGTLEFLGRLDQQVKIRGYRIELGEIESALARHPEVRDACVLAREDIPGQRRLVAYVVRCDASVPEAAELRRHLQETLPEYMVPAVFVPLDALPVTPNGKLDRAALPAPDPDRSLSAREMTPPRNALEHRLARTWSEVLGIGAIGIHDNFFQIGGHSLVAIQLVTRLRESFQVDLPLRTLFDNPTVADLAEIVAQARGSEPALLAPALPEVVPQPERLHEPFPLTDLQQAYWLGQRADFQLGNVSAHIYEELDLPELEVARFEAAWRLLIDRHPMLRAWVLPDGRQQILAEAPPFHIEVLDLQGEEPERAETAVAAVRRQMSEQGPDTSAWPLFEVRVSRLGERRHHVHVSLSLLICDAISGGLLTRELILFYADPDAALPPVEVSFRDYVLSLGAFEESEAYQQSLRYWTERVPSLPPAPELPVLAKLRGESRFVRRTRVIDAPLWERLKARAGQAGVTPTVAVLAAYSEVLAAWSKSPRFTLNLLFFNRVPVHPQINQVVGNFSSTTLLEVDAARNDSFEARAGRLQDQLWKDLEHSRVTGVRVLREIARQQGASSRPAMPVVFTSDIGLERDEPGQEGASVASWGALQTPHVWLDHQVSERQGRLILNWDVVETLFPEEVVDQMFEAYCGLVAALAEPEVWRSAPPRLGPAAHLDLYAAVNATEAPVPEGLLHGLFLRHAQERSEAPAVIAADRILTYGELLREASRVGHRLRQLGARPGTLVAMVMEKGWEQVVGALGVLLSGAAYLPVDPQVPGERLRFLLENGEARLALTQSRFAETLEWPEDVVRLSLETESLDGVEDTPPPSVQRPDDLAYVIFTSGSTGLPKGVAIEHRAALNTILDINRRFGVGPEDRVLALSALNFDLSVYDLFGLLAAGGAIILPEPSSLREPARWAELMSAHRVSLWNSVPALMEMLADDLEGRGQPLPAALRLAMLSGDWIPVRLPDRLRALAARNIDIVSLGGATEASIWSILHPITEVDPRWTSIPYGRPLANQTFHVLGPDLRPRPVWVPGELYIGGAGLAREYWRDEERTRDRFVLQPDTGERLYRTGDLGRWLPDGTIEFLGREDLQVKIQGYRIELGEIEAALSQHPAIRLCAVAALGQGRGARRLVAYNVPDGTSPDAGDLSDFLSRKLPPYMIPTAFVELEAMPLTPNGKLDRRALPEPERGMALAAAGPIPPRDDLEAHLTAIWQDLLGLPSVGIRDGFFDLGGHSLLAVRLMSRIRAELGKDLPLATLFEASTVESLAGVLRQEGTRARTPLVLIRQGGGKPLFLVHPVGGSVLCYRDLAQALGDGPVWALHSPENPPRTIEEMAAAYLSALRAAQPQGPYRLAGWSMGGTLAFEMARQLRSRGEEIELLALIDASVPGAREPLQVDDATLASWFARDLGGLAGRPVHLPPEALRGLTPEDQVQTILGSAREAGALTPGFEAGELRHHLEIFRHNFRALLSYVPGSYPGPVLAITAAEAPAAAAAPWRSLAETVEEHRVPGDHYTLVQPPQVEELARLLREKGGAGGSASAGGAGM